jgi:outer membrane protein assembly factor BamB
MMKFNANGKYAGAYGFGWDQTPAIFQRDDDNKKCNGNATCYSVVIKENHYPGVVPEAYYITQLDQNLKVQWQFKSTNTQSCSRNPDGTQSCVSDHPNGFEWCVNGHLVDANGVVYANSEDGNLYAIGQGGVLKEKIFQQLALGAAYTPASMDRRGRIYSQNAGHMFVIGH